MFVQALRVWRHNPHARERSSYVMVGEDGVPGLTYCLIAFCPSAEAGNDDIHTLTSIVEPARDESEVSQHF